MISPQGVKGDNHLFKEELWGSHQQTWGGHLEKSASGWWRDQRTKKQEWEVKPPSLSALQPLKRHWCCVKSNHKRETLGEHERNGAMKGWRRRGCRGLVLEGRARVCESGPLEVSFCICPIWSPVFLWSRAASCIIPQLWLNRSLCQSETATVKSSTGAIWLCVVSLPASSGFLLNPLPRVLFWYDFSNHDHVCISPSSGLRYALILLLDTHPGLTSHYCMSTLKPFLHIKSIPIWGLDPSPNPL